MTKEESKQLSPLTLAYLGDAIYEMYVRRELIERYAGHTTHDLHKKATRLVRASAQAFTVAALMDKLTSEEQSVFRRGRNMHNATIPKHAEVGDYRAATGFEALLGYLYLTDQQGRLETVLALAKQMTWEDLQR